MKIGIIGEYNPRFKPHVATNDAINHSSKKLGASIQFDWISTKTALEQFKAITESYRGFWIAPGSPYSHMIGALNIIKYCREYNIPLLGTCGGFQHIVIEYARNVLRIEDAEHAEYDPYASNLVVSKLLCSLVGQTLPINLEQDSKIYGIYQENKIKEQYYCNFGLNPVYRHQLHEAGLRTVGVDDNGETRIVELFGHRFFIGTLFVPQLQSTEEAPHCLITEFIKEVIF